MSDGEVAGIGALLKPNKYSILKFVDLHPGGAAALSGLVCCRCSVRCTVTPVEELFMLSRFSTKFISDMKMSQIRFHLLSVCLQWCARAHIQVHEDDRLVAVDGVVVRGMTPQEVTLFRDHACLL